MLWISISKIKPLKKSRPAMLLPITCVLSGLSKYGRPISTVGAIMLILSLRALMLIYPSSLLKSMITLSIDQP
jgi:hypothetical protein